MKENLGTWRWYLADPVALEVAVWDERSRIVLIEARL